MKIGYHRVCNGWYRNVNTHGLGYEYIDFHDGNDERWDNKYFDYYGEDDVDLYHFFNHIYFGKKKWISTFEDLLPRISDTIDSYHHDGNFHNILKSEELTKRLDQISKDNCIAILAQSQWCYDLQKRLMKESGYSHLERKMFMMQVPQKMLPDENIKYDGGVLKLMIVGRDFFRKGGVEVLRALDDLIVNNIELTIVSSLSFDPYARNESQYHDTEVRKIIKGSDWITHYETLPNDYVLELMKEQHVGLLPTWSDTYGCSVLEFQASGVPVITTDVNALKEINNNSCGWVIDIPKNSFGEALYTYKKQRKDISDAIIYELQNIVKDIISNPNIIEEKSKSSLKRVKNNDIDVHYDKLKLLYGS